LDPDVIIAASRAQTVRQMGRLGSTRDDLAELPTPELYEALANDTLDRWAAEGRSVVVIEPVPEFEDGQSNPVSCLSGAEFLEQCTFPILLSTAFVATLRPRLEAGLVEAGVFDE
jgi:hypothetical protein